MSQPDDLEGGLTAEQVKAIFDERAAIMDLVEAIADDADPKRIEDLVERYEEAAQVRSALGLADHQLESSEPIRIEAMAGDRPVKALLIPADPSRPVQMIEIGGRDDLRQHVGGLPEPTRYDRDSLMFVSDTGRLDGMPMNLRATNYIRVESDAAWERGGQLTDDPSYGLYGDVVAVGGSGDGLRDVPDRLIERFAEHQEERDVDLQRLDRITVPADQTDVGVSLYNVDVMTDEDYREMRDDLWALPRDIDVAMWRLPDGQEIHLVESSGTFYRAETLRSSDGDHHSARVDLKARDWRAAFREAQDHVIERVRNTFRDRNEDGMVRIPWFKARSETEKSPSPNWEMNKVEGRTVYYRTQGEAVVWKDNGRWMMDYAVDPQSPTIHADLGRTRSVDKALNRADLTIMSAQVEVHQSYEDVRTVVNLAKEVEDRTPQEQASIDRLQEAIDQGPPPGALDPADDWLDTFNQETQEREQARDEDKDRGV
jgi:hypothetical protein